MKTSVEEKNFRPHTRQLKSELRALVGHLRAGVKQLNAAKAQALFETSAEVLTGLVKAFDDFEKKNEPAWKN